jgi:hypothetical protein
MVNPRRDVSEVLFGCDKTLSKQMVGNSETIQKLIGFLEANEPGTRNLPYADFEGSSELPIRQLKLAPRHCFLFTGLAAGMHRPLQQIKVVRAVIFGRGYPSTSIINLLACTGLAFSRAEPRKLGKVPPRAARAGDSIASRCRYFSTARRKRVERKNSTLS